MWGWDCFETASGRVVRRPLAFRRGKTLRRPLAWSGEHAICESLPATKDRPAEQQSRWPTSPREDVERSENEHVPERCEYVPVHCEVQVQFPAAKPPIRAPE